MSKYEIMYIIRPTLDEAGMKPLKEELSNIITSRDGKVTSKDWGMKDLAYEIEKHNKGFYVLLNVEASIDAINEFDRVAGIREDIIRYMVVKQD